MRIFLISGKSTNFSERHYFSNLYLGLFLAGQSLPLGTTNNQNGEIQFKKVPFDETSPGSRKPNNRERIIQGQMGPHRSVY